MSVFHHIIGVSKLGQKGMVREARPKLNLRRRPIIIIDAPAHLSQWISKVNIPNGWINAVP
jgi:hypothetical protein